MNFFSSVLTAFEILNIITMYEIEVRNKVYCRTGREGPEGELWYSSTRSWTSALDWVGGQHHAPFALPPGKSPGTRFAGWAPGPVWRIKKISPPLGFDPQTVQPVASRCIPLYALVNVIHTFSNFEGTEIGQWCLVCCGVQREKYWVVSTVFRKRSS